MKKLIQILAFSAGGGLLVGAGLRLAGKRGTGPDGLGPLNEPDDRIALFLDRLESLERRFGGPPPGSEQVAGIGTPASEPGTATFKSGDLQGEMSAQIGAMEDRLRRDLGSRNEARIASLSDEIHKRIDSRMEPIEKEIAVQRATVDELKEYSLRTERSLQKLLEGVDRLVAAQGPRASGPVAG